MTISENEKVLVSIVVPTLGRNEDLQRAVGSLFALPDAACKHAELIVVDNSADRAASSIFESLQANATIPMIYISEPDPGVSNARNAGLAAANSSLIAFIDDDETAESGWLDGLLKAHETYDAAVVFGPVRTILPDNVTKHRDYFAKFFERSHAGPEGLTSEYYGCGNSLLDLDRIRPCLLPGADYFDARANSSGGEDDVLFHQIQQHGERFAWTESAIVYEHAPAKRVSLSYTLRRAFAYGQGPSTSCWRQRPTNYIGLLFWMIIGAGQFGVYGAIAGMMWLTRHPKRASMLDRAVRGLGKLLWFPPFKLSFYGGSAIGNPTPKHSEIESSAPATTPKGIAKADSGSKVA